MKLPLFPYTLVLFPGAEVPLRFFEPRYRKMCEDIIGVTNSFGVVMARPESVFEEEVPFDIGTVARIAEHARLPDGQWLVQTIGTVRFKVLELGLRRPYLTADVEIVEETAGNDLRAYAIRDAAIGKLRRLFALRTEFEEQPLPVNIDIPEDPGRASYEIASVMGLRLDAQQRLLEIEADDDRLAAEVRLLDAAIAEVERGLTTG